VSYIQNVLLEFEMGIVNRQLANHPEGRSKEMQFEKQVLLRLLGPTEINIT
jgi:hypothetical protein